MSEEITISDLRRLAAEKGFVLATPKRKGRNKPTKTVEVVGHGRIFASKLRDCHELSNKLGRYISDEEAILLRKAEKEAKSKAKVSSAGVEV